MAATILVILDFAGVAISIIGLLEGDGEALQFGKHFGSLSVALSVTLCGEKRLFSVGST
jgi:hypothetical protein